MQVADHSCAPCDYQLMQVICGSPLTGQATFFLTSSGLSPSTASTLNLIMFVIGGVGTVCSWFIMQPFGRRTLYLWGQIGLSTLMLLVGILGCLKRSDGVNWALGGLLIAFVGLYDLTVGPVCYSLVAEIGSTRLRAKTVRTVENFPIEYSRLIRFTFVGSRLFWLETSTISQVSSFPS